MTTRMCNFVNIMVNQMYYNMKTFISPLTGLKYERHEYNLFGQLHRKIFYYSDSSLRHSDELIDSKGFMYCKKIFS